MWAAGGNGIAVWTGIDGYGPGKGYIEQAGIAGACLEGQPSMELADVSQRRLKPRRP